jgi:aspartate/methionine/tyrosine aminotransferase
MNSAQNGSENRTRRIPASGINLFQLIYILIREYEAQAGQKVLNLSLGNPDLIPTDEVLNLRAFYQKQKRYELHTYAEDNNIDQFCEGMVRAFTGLDYSRYPHLKAVPIPGIKTATSLLPLACGMHLKDRKQFHVVSNLPAYDVIGTWSNSYLATNRIVWPLSADDGMTLNVERLKTALQGAGVEKPDLIFVIRPGNPAARGASEAEWKEIIEFCISRGIRLVNDGAYTTLATPQGHVPLSQVAKDYPALEWAELLSVSKSFSDPGARLGVMVGSKEFIEDFILIKGNTESGPVPSIMAAYADLFRDEKLTRKIMDELLDIYQKRLGFLVPALKKAGLRPACETTAGFFTLWRTPDIAYGINLREEAQKRGMPRAELYNRLVIEKTGIVGVHFTGPAKPGAKPGEDDAYIRYAVCTDVLLPEFQARFLKALEEIKPQYINN